jgi:GntR family transcriptional regulator, carbon starvation induced regulator
MNVPEIKPTSGKILSEQAYDLIRRDILGAELLPGEKLLIDAVSQRYDIGVNPIREALNRLSSEGWVERKSQRGFFVSKMSMPELEELVYARVWLETRALRDSIENATDEWEERLIISYHRLARTQRNEDTSVGKKLNPEWERHHKDFHMKLLERCGSSWLLGFCSTMMDQAVRYRNLSVNFNLARRGDALAEHRELLDAVLDRNPDLSQALLEAHYRSTLEGLRKIID